jgi:hypothetical protein
MIMRGWVQRVRTPQACSRKYKDRAMVTCNQPRAAVPDIRAM